MLKLNKLGKEHKLKDPISFQRVYKNATKFYSKGINLFVCSNELTYSRLGVSIPKKQIPRAVDRNRIRRIVREYFRLKNKELTVQLDLVFVVYATLLELSNLEITKCLEVLWTKLTNYCEKV